MAANFIDSLPFPEEDRAKLASFGALSPFALLSIRKASKEAFDNYVGRDRVDRIVCYVESLLTDEQRESLKQPSRGGAGKLGARLDPVPTSKISR
jgi:hypothetical protein